MLRVSRLALPIVFSLTMLVLVSCGQGSPTKPTTPTPPSPPPVQPVPSRITIAPSSPTLNAIGQTVQLRALVQDQNNNALTGAVVSWSSSNTSVASVSTQGLVTALSNGIAQITARSGSVSANVGVTVAAPVANRPPQPAGQISPQVLSEGGSPVELDVSGAFQDPDGDDLEYTAESGDVAVATVTVSGAMVTISPVSAGSTTITVTASDPAGLTAMQTIIVTVEPPENRPPETLGSIVVQELTVGGSPVEVDVSGSFHDPDGDDLTYTAESSDDLVASVTISGARVTIQPLSAGNATVTVTASDGTLTAEQRIDVTIRQTSIQGADLIVYSPMAINVKPGVGTSFLFRVSVRNQGDDDATSSTLRYYLSSDETISSHDTVVNTYSLDAIEAFDTSGSEVYVWVTLRAPTVPGTYFYGACVDPVAGESDTQNNCSGAVAVTVNGPDLIVESLAVSSDKVNVGDTFILSVTVRNQSDNDALSRTTLRVYLSTDETISNSDTEISGVGVSSLEASETSEEQVYLNAPQVPGMYFIGACVDPVAEESDTQNNCSGAVTVMVVRAPDLIVEFVSTRNLYPEPGSSFTLDVTVRNRGVSETVSTTTLRYYLSTDGTISNSDTEVGAGEVSILDASERSRESIVLTAPSTPGTYYYGACVDPSSEESDTLNNCSDAEAVMVRFANTPDLEVRIFRASVLSAEPGSSFSLRRNGFQPRRWRHWFHYDYCATSFQTTRRYREVTRK